MGLKVGNIDFLGTLGEPDRLKVNPIRWKCYPLAREVLLEVRSYESF